MNLNDALRVQMLNIHCADLAVTRMRIVIMEAKCAIYGWTTDELCRWRDYNDQLIRLGIKTRSLLAF